MSLSRMIVFLAIIALSEAFVELENSRIYDEKDFEGRHVNFIPNYCAEGCQIFVSVPDDSINVAKNIRINDFSKKLTRLTDANKKDAKGRKRPYVVKKGNSQVDFINRNSGLKSAPILVWLVRGDAPNINNAEVYDADDTYRAQAPAGLITVLSAEPFVVTTDTAGPMTMTAYTAGFDALNSATDKCTRVLRQENPLFYQDIRIALRSPLITLVFANDQFPDTKIALRASKDDVPSFDLSKPMFATSPGYIGCSVNTEHQFGHAYGVRHKTYRSSLYDANITYNFQSDETVHFYITSDINVDEDHVIQTTVDDEPPERWCGCGADPSRDFSGKKLEISWTRNDDDLDGYFLLRVEPANDMKKPVLDPSETTTEDRISTTTEVPEQETTTTTEAIPTTATEPETTTPGPDSTTVELDTTTTEPETTTTVPNTTTPEPNITTREHETTTMEPGTTTVVPETTTPVPETTTVEPKTTTVEHETTTMEPGTTIVVPGTTTPVQETNTPVPETTTGEHETTTMEPGTTTVVPETTTPEPDTTTAAELETTTTVHDTATAMSVITTVAVSVTSVEPDTTTAEAETTSLVPETTTAETETTTEPETTEKTTLTTSTRYTRRSTTMPLTTHSTTTPHPKSTTLVTKSTTTTTTTVAPTTSGAGYAPLLLTVFAASVLILL